MLNFPKPKPPPHIQNQNPHLKSYPQTPNRLPQYWKYAIFTYFSIFAIITCAYYTRHHPQYNN